ncbi:hypothetical protein D3C72_1526990 [compost metagenome]
MMRRQHHIGLLQSQRRQFPLLRRADVPGQQQGMALALHTQHATVRIAVVRLRTASRPRMQEREHHPVRLPPQPALAPRQLLGQDRLRIANVRPHPGVAPQEGRQVE